MERKTIGSFIAVLRKAKGLTQRELANKLNVSDKAISRWERDECAPDLSVLPVLAEIFDVTIDELVRGQRSAPENRDPGKTGKQLQHLLDATWTRFQTRSIPAVIAALIGLIVAICGYWGISLFPGTKYAVPTVGMAMFLICTIPFLIAVGLEAGFLIQALATLKAEGIPAESLNRCKCRIIRLAQTVFSLIAVFLAACTPLVRSGSEIWANGLGSMVSLAVSPVLGTAIVCILNVFLINRKLGYERAPKTAALCISLCAALMVTHTAQSTIMPVLQSDPLAFGKYTEFSNFADFKDHIQQMRAPNGEKVDIKVLDAAGRTFSYADSEGNTEVLTLDQVRKVISSPDGKIMDVYYHYNRTVAQVICSEDQDRLPVVTITYAQQKENQKILNWIGYGWIALYFLEFLTAVLIYRKKCR